MFRVERGRDSEIADTTEAVGRRVRLARVLLHREDACIPRLAARATSFVNRKPQVITDFGTGRALDLIFVHDGRPDPRQVNLSGRRLRGAQPRERRQHGDSRHTAVHMSPELFSDDLESKG